MIHYNERIIAQLNQTFTLLKYNKAAKASFFERNLVGIERSKIFKGKYS